MSEIIPIDNLPPIHPGEFLSDFLDDEAMPFHSFSIRSGISQQSLIGILDGRLPIDSNLAQRIGQVTNTSPQYWRNLQSIYDSKK